MGKPRAKTQRRNVSHLCVLAALREILVYREVHVMGRVFLAGCVCAFCLVCARAGDESGKKATIAFVQKLQTATGGFLPNRSEKKPTLRATTAAIRALRYLGGD